ncbi:hypothetical protein PQX77_003584 [Marasmius sp. AFHP31]|nr:hypothetical protein PQX77_003584 [Marasmius sp. AFHP31]
MVGQFYKRLGASSPPGATDSNTSSSNSLRAKIIGSSVGGGTFLVILVVIFLFLRGRRTKQRRGKQQTHKVMRAITLFAIDQQLQSSYETAAIIRPFSPTTPVLKSSREQKETLSTSASNLRKAVEVSNPRVAEPAGGEPTIDPQQPHTGRDDSESGETLTLGDDNRYRAMQAQMQLLRQRVDRMEGAEEAPPDYVSAEGSR